MTSAATDGGHASGRKSSLLPDTLSARVASEITVIGGLALTNVVEFPDDECLVARVSHDKAVWAVGLASGKALLYSTEACAPAYSLDPPERRERQSVTGLAFVPSDSASPEQKHLLLASHATGQVRLWHYTGVTGAPLWTLEEKCLAADGSGRTTDEANQILCLACSGDGQRFATGGVDGNIRVYDTRRRTQLGLCQSSHSDTRVDGHRSRVCSIVYHPLGRQYPAEFGHIFLSGGWDNTVQIWDDRYSHSLWVYFGPHVCGSDAIDIDPLHNHILTGSWERQRSMLQVWKFNEDTLRGPLDLDDKAAQAMLRAKPLGELPQDQATTPSMGYVAQWLGEQYMVYGGSNANVLKVVDRGTLNIIGSVTNLPKGVYSVASLQPELDSKRPYKLAMCAGNRLYVLRFDRK